MRRRTVTRAIALIAFAVAVTCGSAALSACAPKETNRWSVPSDGGEITAYFSDNGKNGYILTLEGSGKMLDYTTSADAPWYNKSGRVTEVRISDGITYVGANAFSAIKVGTVIIPRSVTAVGDNAFGAKTALCAYGQIDVAYDAAVCLYSQTAPQSEQSKYWRVKNGQAVIWDNIKVLFIGNSFTFYSDVPALFQSIAESANESVTVESVTQGSHTLTKFADASDPFGKTVDDKLRASNDYDVVILQEQSTRPINNYNGFLTAVKSLQSKINETQQNCKIYLYSTWGYAEAADSLKITIPQMEERIRAAYDNAAAETDLKVCYVGKAFSKVYAEYTDINLYFTDNKHQSYAGAFLSACVHAATILDVNPCNTAFTGELDADTAATLKQVAYSVSR